jgi:Holliday junction resolvase RusA-like endonuclease
MINPNSGPTPVTPQSVVGGGRGGPASSAASVSQREATELVCLNVPGRPVPKGRPRVVKGHAYTPARTAEAEARLLSHLKVHYPHMRPVQGAMSVTCDFYLSGERSIDIDNALKLVLDAFNGVVWQDDSQVVEVHAHKYCYSIPRTEISVSLLHGKPFP